MLHRHAAARSPYTAPILTPIRRKSSRRLPRRPCRASTTARATAAISWNACRTRQRTISDIETAHRANSVLLLGGIACRLGRKLKWDPEKETFPDDAEANRLLSMAAREPWRI